MFTPPNTDPGNSAENKTALEVERQALANSGRLHWFHWAILLFSALLTVAAWRFSAGQVEDKQKLRFDREATHVIELLSERMDKYEVALRSGVATVRSLGGKVSHEEWQAFAESLHIETKYPGINGIGVIDYVPAEDKAAYLDEQRSIRSDFTIKPLVESEHHFPIRLIVPEAPNVSAIGLDMVHEQNRLEGALKARDSGQSQITGPIVLVQDANHTPGFLFFAPYYNTHEPQSLEARRREFSGLVYAPFIVEKLLAGTLDLEKRLVAITLSDGDQVLFDETRAGNTDIDPAPMFTTQKVVSMYGRKWTFDIHTTKSFRAVTQSGQPELILFGGILLDALLLTLFLVLTRANRRALRFSDQVAFALREQTRSLEQSNADLESFAYIASHDLRTPLRGMSDLVDFLEEDLENYLSRWDANSEVAHNIGRLRKQVGRLEGLINGILEYSSIGAKPEAPEWVDVRAAIDVMRAELGVRAEQLTLSGDVEEFVTYRLRFEQVIGNLVNNAFKYHPDSDAAQVNVSCADLGDWIEFSVSDNGAGIDPKHHQRIFEAFQTLQSRDEVESTGVGLSIVKKTVERLGGAVRVDSCLGRGSTFSFVWPKTA